MPSCAICCLVENLDRDARLAASDGRRARANSCGVSVLPGSLASSRARLLHSPSSRPLATASTACDAASVAGRRQDDRPRRTARGVVLAASCSCRRRTPPASALRRSPAPGRRCWRRRIGVRAQHEGRARDAALSRATPDGDRQLPRQVGAERPTLPAPTSATPPGLPVPVGDARREESNGRAANSLDCERARRHRPPVAASMPGTAAGPSPSNQGTTSRSASTGPRRRARADDRAGESSLRAAIRLLSTDAPVCRLQLAPLAQAYNPCKPLARKDLSDEHLATLECRPARYSGRRLSVSVA